MRLVVALSVAACLAVFLLYTSIAGGTTPSLRPSQLAGHTGRVSLAGRVLAPVTGDARNGGLHFRLRDVNGAATVPVIYTGSVPDLIFHIAPGTLRFFFPGPGFQLPDGRPTRIWVGGAWNEQWDLVGSAAYAPLPRPRTCGGNVDQYDVTGTIADENASDHRHKPAAACGRERREEKLRARRPAGKRASTKAHAQSRPGFSERDVEPQDPGFVLTLESDQMASGVEHRHAQWLKIRGAGSLKRHIDDDGSLRERQRHDGPPIKDEHE